MNNEPENNDQTKKIAANAAGKEISIKEFLSAFYDDDEIVFVKLFEDKKENEKGKGLPAVQFFQKLSEIDDLIPSLKYHNNLGYNVAFSVNGAICDEEVTKIRAQFFEADDLTIEEQLQNINSFPLKPSIIVRTRNSLHVYFRIKNGNLESFRRIQMKLIKHFHADKNITDKSRSLRLPSFYHMKEEPLMVECILFNPELIYTQEQLEQYLPELDEIKPTDSVSATERTYKKGTKEQLDFLLENCDFIKHCRDDAKILGEIDWYAMVGNLCNFEGGPEKIHEISKPYPRYSQFDTDQKIEHFLNSGTAPMHCQTIASKGFVCPHLGSCSCSSPAGLPFGKKISTKYPLWYKELKNGNLILMSGVLTRYLTETFRALFVGERFYVFDNGVYSEVSDYEVQRIVRDHLLEEKVRTSEITDVIAQWKMLIYEDADVINNNLDVINVKNGLLNIKTKELMPHTPECLSTIRINANYDNKADCPRFKAFLDETLEPELIPIVQQIIGYCCTGYMSAQKAFCFKGVSKSGKSRIVKVVETLVGRKNFSNVAWQDLSGRFSTSCLYGKILNTFSDLPSRAIDDNGVFKSLIGPDMLQVERKNRDPFSFLSKCKLLFSANEMPHNSGDKSEGFFSKLIIIRFLKSVEIDRIDPDLLTRFIEEIDGIFNWAMQGLDTLIANKFAFSKSVIVNEEVYKYKRNSNNVLSYVDELCEFDPSYFILSQELFNHYKNVCNTNGFKSLSISNFNLEMVSNYGSKITQAFETKTRRSIWKGIRFIDNPNVSEEELMQIMQALNTTEEEGTAKVMRRPYKD